MARSLKYPAYCYKCGKYCDPKKEKEEKIVHRAFLQRYRGKWMAHCYECYKNKVPLPGISIKLNIN